MSKIKVTKLINNQYIIGKTCESAGFLNIEDPYQLVPDIQNISMLPYDEWILGKKIQTISISIDNIIYSEEPSEALKNTYLESLTGLEIPDNQLIV